jgi:hypothetical protein
MKIVFLDFDGVINSSIFFNKRKLDESLRMSSPEWWAEMIDPEPVALLNQILDQTGAKVVISSTWRFANTWEELQEILEVRGFTGEVIGATPKMNAEERWEKINKWLDDGHVPVESFVILDDLRDMGDLQDHLVNTNVRYGLKKKHVKAAVRLLNESV